MKKKRFSVDKAEWSTLKEKQCREGCEDIAYQAGSVIDERDGKVYGLVGDTRWICGFAAGKAGRPLPDFNHLHDKDFGITIRNIGQLSWMRLYAEIKKCILVCCRCHGCIHH